jgi:hypothetical protein
MTLRLRLDQASDRLRSMDVLGLLRKSIYSEETGVGLRKDLTTTDGSRVAQIPYRIRPGTDADLHALLDDEQADPSDAQDQVDRRIQRRIASAIGTHGCWVADAGDGSPGFVQYLFFPDDNELFQEHFSHTGPPLAEQEAMVEFLYVAPAARTMSFIIDCMTLVVDEARRQGARSVVTFPNAGNRGAIMASHFVGFRPYAVRRSRYRLFRKSTTYEIRPARMSETL